MSKSFNYNLITAIFAVCLISVTYIICNGTTELKKVVAMSEAVAESSNKGINPIATRCAFADSNDTICIVYASNKNQMQSFSSKD
jgi:hypothetical protein